MSGPEPGSDRLLVVGRIVKPHGLKGDVIVALTTNRDERVAPGSVLTGPDGGRYVVSRSSPHHGRFIVAFEGVSGIGAADALRETPLFAPPIEDPDTLWVHELVGAEAVNVTGRRLGTVESMQANPASDLLVLDDGGLIPLRFVIEVEASVRVVVDIPDGLLDGD